MSTYRRTCEALSQMEPSLDLYAEFPVSMLKLAGAPPLPPAPPSAQKADPFSATKRDIPADHKFDPKALKPMSRMLWAMAVSLGHALTAYRQFTRLKSVTVSPDGLVGGRGYVMSVKDVRAKLYEACEALSAISDTIHDEINAPHWKPKLGELEKQDLEEVEKFVGEAEGIMGDPEGEAEEDLEEVENKKTWSPSRFQEDAENGASKMPSGGDSATTPSQGPQPASAFRPDLKKQASSYSYNRTGNSSVSPNELPGPRVDHLDRAEDGRGPFDSYNDDEALTEDDWGEQQGVGSDYAYHTPWENNLSEKSATGFGEYAESAVPGDPDTRTEGYDFGIGYAEGNDAHGQGAGGYGVGNPSSGGRGVYGPRADLPSDPAGATRDRENSDSNPSVDVSLNNRNKFAVDVLPNDDLPPVARSDYFQGPKGNDFNGVIHADSEMPGDSTTAPYDNDRDTMDTGYKHEQGDEPYVKWDDSTHNMRIDPTYQRGPVQGPYVKQ